MRHVARRRALALALSSLGFATSLAAPALAQDLAPPPPADPSVGAEPVAWFTLAPLDRIDAALARGGFPGVGDRLAGLFTALHVVTAAEVDHTVPAQALIVINDELGARRSGTFAIPVVKDGAPLERFAGAGQPLAGHDDTIAMGNGGALRRIARHLILGTTVKGALTPSADAIAAAVKDERTLLDVRFDGVAMRRAAPQTYAEFLESTEASARKSPTATPAEAAGQEAGREFAVDAFRRVETASFRLATAGEAGAGEQVAAELRYTPFTLPAVPANFATFVRPAFPKQTVSRLDYRYPLDVALPTIAEGSVAFVRFLNSVEPDAKLAGAEAEMGEMLTAMADLMLGDAVSIGVEYRGDGPLAIFAVSQRAKPAPLADRMARAESAMRKVIAKTDDQPLWKLSHYDEAGHRVTRLELMDNAKRFTVVDLTEVDGRQYASMHPTDKRVLVPAIATLANNAPGGKPIAHLAESSLNLPLVERMLRESPSEVPAPLRAMLAPLMASGTLDMTVDGDGKAFLLRMQLPLASVGKLMAQTIP